MRRFMVSSGTGLEKSSYSLQYVAGEIAAANRDDVRQDGMVGRRHALGDHLQFAEPAFRSDHAPAHSATISAY